MKQKQDRSAKEIGAYEIFSQCDFDEPAVYSYMQGKLLVYSRTSPIKTTANEDSVAFVSLAENTGVLVVADGLGGHPGGENASALLVQTLIDNALACESAMLREAILSAVDEVNQILLRQGNGSATTLCVLEIHGNTVRSYSIGDSMILIMGQRGRIKFQTIAHSPVGYALEAGMLEEAEAITHEERHVVSNVVGCADMKIDIGPTISLAPRDRVIICSDGLSDNLLTQEIVDIVRSGPLDQVGGKLFHQCRENMQSEDGHPDDLSFLVLTMTA